MDASPDSLPREGERQKHHGSHGRPEKFELGTAAVDGRCLTTVPVPEDDPHQQPLREHKNGPDNPQRKQ